MREKKEKGRNEIYLALGIAEFEFFIFKIYV